MLPLAAMASPTEVPGLRRGVEIQRDPATAAVRLLDVVLGQRVGLDAGMAAVAAVLDRPQSVEEVARRSGQGAAVVAQTASALTARHLLDVEGARRLASDAGATRQIAGQDAASVPLLIRADAAFECTMCGSCCGGHNIGPVFDDTLEGLEPHSEALQRATGATSGLFVTMPGPPDSAPRVLCRSRGGWCVFLADDGGCVIHRDLGGAMKPRSCQLFPFEFTATPDGIAVSVSTECRDLRNASEGQPLAEREDHIRSLLALVPVEHRDRLRPVLRLDRATALSYGDYAALEDQLHEAVDAHPTDPSDGLLAMRSALSPGAISDRGSEEAGLGELLGRLTSDMADALRSMRHELHQEGPGFVNRADGLDPMIEALVDFRAHLGRAAAAPRDPAVAEVFALSTHQRLMSKELCQTRTVHDGFARMAWSWLLARALMIRHARAARRFHVTGDDAMDALVTITFLHRTEPVKRLLDHHADALRDLCLDRLPELLAGASDLTMVDERVELVSF